MHHWSSDLRASIVYLDAPTDPAVSGCKATRLIYNEHLGSSQLNDKDILQLGWI